MIRHVTATRAKNNFGELIKRIYTRRECVIVEKGGIPVVAIVPISNLGPRQATPPLAPFTKLQREKNVLPGRMKEMGVVIANRGLFTIAALPLFHGLLRDASRGAQVFWVPVHRSLAGVAGAVPIAGRDR